MALLLSSNIRLFCCVKRLVNSNVILLNSRVFSQVINKNSKQIQRLKKDQNDRKFTGQKFDDDKGIDVTDNQFSEPQTEASLSHDDLINELIIECNAGVGGQEAMLFASEMLEMYQRYCGMMKWTFKLISYDDTDLGGSRRAAMLIKGSRCYSFLKHEAGVHRVQRIPKTERAGRVHTSTVTVSVLPINDKFRGIQLNKRDLEFEMKTSSGAGGQHVNKTKSCVRVTHIPTGTVVECQEERSQIRNKEIALEKLKRILTNKELSKRKTSEIETKKSQVGIAARSDKIRTYNFAQDRITDHRLGQTVYDIDEFFNGKGNKLNQIILKLQQNET